MIRCIPVLFLCLAACTSKPSPEQVQTYESQKKAADAAENRVKVLETDKAAIQAEIAQERKQQELLRQEIRHVEEYSK